jgi:hypothetical protein
LARKDKTMRLSLLHEYWMPIAGHPGKLGELDSRTKKKERISFLKYPKDRERFSKWLKGKK